MKKTISVLMTVFLLINTFTFAFSVFAADVVSSGFCGGEGDGTNLSWVLDSEGTLTISGEGKMADYSSHEAPWYPYHWDIAELIVEDGVKSIGKDAFLSLGNLLKVTLGDSVETLRDSAFMSCVKLSEINLSSNLKTIEMRAFYQNPSLISISLPNTLETIGDFAFEYCSKLEKVVFPASVSNISSSAFPYCRNLKRFEVASGNASYSTDSNGVLMSKDKTVLCIFPAGSALESYTVPSSVQAIKTYAFHSAKSLSEIDVPDSVTKIERYAFYGCEDITSFRFPSGLSKISEIMFTECSSLESVIIPESVSVIEAGLVTNNGTFKYVFYLGTREEWESISIGEKNEALLNAAIHFEADDHTPAAAVIVNPVEATCTTDGSYDEVVFCSQCPLELSRNHVTVTEPINHKNVLTVDEVEATHNEHGFTAGEYCSDCGTWISGHEVIHNTDGERIILREPTEDENGLAEIYCTVCGEKGLYSIEKKPESEDDNSIIAQFRKAVKGIIDWFLRLIKWLGGNKKK